MGARLRTGETTDSAVDPAAQTTHVVPTPKRVRQSVATGCTAVGSSRTRRLPRRSHSTVPPAFSHRRPIFSRQSHSLYPRGLCPLSIPAPMEGFKDQVMNLLNGSEALSGEKIMSVISDLQPVLPSLKHLKVVSVVRGHYTCAYRFIRLLSRVVQIERPFIILLLFVVNIAVKNR